MSDTYHDDPYTPPTRVPEPESLESFRAAELPSRDPFAAPEPLVPAEPLPLLSGASGTPGSLGTPAALSKKSWRG
jgi:hypothetical protein